MDISGFLGGLTWLPVLVVVVVVAIVLAIVFYIYFKTHYKIADANQALVVTGGKSRPKIMVGGSKLIPPLRKGEFFDLGIMTVNSSNDETQTSSMIPVIVEYTAQLRADTSMDENGELNESLRNAIYGFTGYKGEDIRTALQQTLEGEVRQVVATMTPEELVRDKAKFAAQVDDGVVKSMQELGFKLVSLNIGKISDKNNYYINLAASEREGKRREAKNIEAEANQLIAVRTAEADQIAKAAEQQRDLALSEQQRDLAIRRAAFKAETAIAEADAEIAGELQKEVRNQDLATRKGEVAVIEEQQNQTAAVARREVKVTEAETAKQTQVIEAEATARKVEIDAGAAAKKLEIDTDAAAKAAKLAAEGRAEAAIAEAKGHADATNLTTEATARNEREVGLAKAEVIKAQGEAEAAAILARGTSEAEAQRLMADALAANDGANLQVTIAEIESKTRITIATQTATVMAEVGKNAKFVDMGGANGKGGNLLSNVLGDLPGLLARLDVESDALNNASFGGTIGAVIAAAKNGVPVVPADSASVDQPAPAVDASQSSDESTSAPEPSAQVPAPVAEPASVDEVDPITAAAIGRILNGDTLDEVLAEASSQGVSLAQLAERYGVPTATLEKALQEKFTPSELLEKGITIGKKSRSSRSGS